jgi:hypothetical protein
MNKILLASSLVFACSIAWSQPSVILDQSGLRVTVESKKIEEEKNHDRWEISIVAENSSPTEIFFMGPNDAAGSPYIKIDVPNKKGFFTEGIFELRGERTGMLTSDGSVVYRVPQNIRNEKFNTNVEKGATPEIKAGMLITPHNVTDFDVLRASPMDVMNGSRPFFINGPNSGYHQSDPALKFLNWDMQQVAASLNGNQFSIAPNGDFTNATSFGSINILGWDRSKITASIDAMGNGFMIYRNGNIGAAQAEPSLNFVGWDGYNYTARLGVAANNTVANGQRLLPGEVRRSRNGLYSLAFQNDGNLVLTNLNNNFVIWASGTNNKNASNCMMQSDGNLVIYSASGQTLWSSSTSGSNGAYLLLQDDGNVVIYKPDGNGAWCTRTKGR